MIDEIRQMIDSYHIWLRENITFREVEDCVEITVPFLDRHNDHLQIYAKPSNGGFLLSDDGYTIDDLELCGCNLDSPKRQQLLKETLNGFGVQLDNRHNALHVNATNENFAMRKHNLIQSMLAVNDLFYLASSHIASFFFEDVEAWLDQAGIQFKPKVKFPGKSGFYHHFDFVIPESGIHPERILLSINRPERAAVNNVMLAWLDTGEARSRDSRAYAILNDQQKAVHPNLLDALQNYDMRPVPWSDREAVREELAA